MKRLYQIAEQKDNRALTEYLAQHGPLLLPMGELLAAGAGGRSRALRRCRPGESLL